eukprot:TRINITY_DN12243_c0_g1_i6.p1 TRINITY_DN12243_c0_g1~~TRINITY_DN12243_c0_g1_i6.p1  ORF type:complete len:221 (+),score=59.10 TRINITY_DN12243_c0_g1_i6:313-975(+)
MQKTAEAVKAVRRLEKLFLFRGVTEQSLYLVARELAKEVCVSRERKVYTMLKWSSFNVKKKQFKVDLKNVLRNKKQNALLTTEKINEGMNELLGIYDASRRLSQKINDDLLAETEGLYILLSGKCEIRNPNDNYLVDTITPCDFFGECDFFESIGYNYFGDIITVEDCRFLYVGKDRLRAVPEYDRKVMQRNSARHRGRVEKMIFQCAKVYGGNPYEIKY